MAPPHKKARLSVDANGDDKQVQAEAAATSPAKPDEKSEEQLDKDKKDAAKHQRSLFVRSLPASTTTESLTAIFSHSYPIKHATAVIDRETKTCKGYGFVTFADAEDAARAKAEFNGHTLEGKKLRVEIAEPRQREDRNDAAAATATAAMDGDEDGVAVVPAAASKPATRLTPGQRIKEARELERSNQPGTKLIVRNLPWSVKTAAQLERLFLSYGKVKKAAIPTKGKGGLMAGFGFVTMRGRKNAEKAMEGVNGKEVDGRTLAVDWAVEKGVWQGMQDGGEPSKANTGDGEEGDDVKMTNGVDDELDEEAAAADSELEGMSDYEDADDDEEDDEGEDDQVQHKTEDRSLTLFVRNLPFTATDETLEDHFRQFGSTRYARVVMDHATDRSKGTGFVCFYDKDDADTCLKSAPRLQPPKPADGKSKGSGTVQPHSLLQDEYADPSGKYSMDGRVLQISRAVDKSEASRLTQEGVAYRNHRDRDKRRLYLLSEGTIPSNSALWEQIPPSERTMRETSAKQRKSLIESNPSLSLSLTRLSVRNIPRSITSEDLKQLARAGYVGFATDVKAGKRTRLSKEELARGGEEMQAAETDRRARQKGIVKQSKIVYEGREGSKVSEDSGAGRSRGYGFIEYHTHRSALMGLRWLNGHSVDYQAQEAKGKGKKAQAKVDISEKKKRLIVEFAIENAQVVGRRNEREAKAKERLANGETADEDGGDRKRKRGQDDEADKEAQAKSESDEKLAKRSRIIQQKRMQRRAKRKGAA